MLNVRDVYMSHDELSCETSSIPRAFFKESLEKEEVKAFFSMIEINADDATRVFNMLEKESRDDVDVSFASSRLHVCLWCAL